MSGETLQFKTELKQLLHLIIHSLYSHKDIFLRELISNASDAIDTVRFQSLTDGEVLEGNADWKIQIIPDEQAGTLTISDNGVGMSKATIVEWNQKAAQGRSSIWDRPSRSLPAWRWGRRSRYSARAPAGRSPISRGRR